MTLSRAVPYGYITHNYLKVSFLHKHIKLKTLRLDHRKSYSFSQTTETDPEYMPYIKIMFNYLLVYLETFSIFKKHFQITAASPIPHQQTQLLHSEESSISNIFCNK